MTLACRPKCRPPSRPDEVALLAQGLGYAVSGSDLLMLSDRSVEGVRVTRVDHPGEYPGRYY